jgi:hypothetical protein
MAVGIGNEYGVAWRLVQLCDARRPKTGDDLVDIVSLN